jgi:hypothetical protein
MILELMEVCKVKSGLILTILMVSVTSFANSVTIQCGSRGNTGESAITNVFSGQINLTTQADEVVFADSFISIKKGEEKAQPELLTLMEMHGTQHLIEEEESGDRNVNQISLQTDEETPGSAYIVVNLNSKGSNSSVSINNANYSAHCEVVANHKN